MIPSDPHPAPGAGDSTPPAPPSPARPINAADAWRATFGVIATYGAGLVFAGLVALLTDPAVGQIRSAGSTRAQLAVQSVIFAALAMLLVESLRLAHRPGPKDVLSNPASTARARPPLENVIAIGVVVGALSQLAGPLVSAVLPGVHNPHSPTHGLGIGSGTGADLGTVLVVVGLVPFGEELLFRGVLAGSWLRVGRPGIAIVSSALLFGLAHVTVGPRSILVDGILGALLAGSLIWSGSLGAPVLAHCSVNAIALLNAGLSGAAPVVLLVFVTIGTTLAAAKLSPLVSWQPPGDTLSP